MKAKISEIFYSLQLEGGGIGYPSVFVRFSGCNLRCVFCDTKYALDDGVLMDVRELGDCVRVFNCNRVIFTGGEPVLYDAFMSEFAREYPHFRYFLETNGTIFPEESWWCFEHVVVSPKIFALSRDVLCRFLRYNDVEFKFVVGGPDDVDKYMAVADELGLERCVLQPVWVEGDSPGDYVKRTIGVIEHVKAKYGNRDVRVIMQNQKIIYGEKRGV